MKYPPIDEALTVFECPELVGRRACAEIDQIYIVEVDGKFYVRFRVRRDLNFKISSFTFKFCDSTLPIEEIDEQNFSSTSYNMPAINEKKTRSFSCSLEDGYIPKGFVAFISEIVHEDGTVETFSNTDYRLPSTIPYDDGVEWAEDAEKYAQYLSGSYEADYSRTPFADKAQTSQNGEVDDLPRDDASEVAPEYAEYSERAAEGKRKPRSAHKRTIAIAALAVVVALGAALGVGYFYLKGAVTSTVEALIAEERYTEAYKVAESRPFGALRIDTARRASEYYLKKGEFKQAYVFAALAGDTDAVTDAALDSLAALGVDAPGTEAFAVAMKSPKTDRFNSALTEICASLCESANYERAMNVTLCIADDETRTELSSSIFYEGVSFFTSHDMYENAAALVRRFGSSHEFDGAVGDDAIKTAVSYCIDSGDAASAVLLAKYFGYEYTDIDIEAHDPSVRMALSSIYPLLTATQKRAYHSYPLGFCKEAYAISGGKIAGTDIVDAAAVDTYETRTVILHTNGEVTMLENGGHNETDEIPPNLGAVQAVCGLHHTVVLKADGTVAAFGSNAYGQCEVGEWREIVKVAAGRYFTLGLRADGTLVACGSNRSGQCNVDQFHNVVDIGACDQTSVMMFADGKVALAGDVTLGLYEAYELTDVVEISARANTIAAKLADGTYRIMCGADGASAGDSAKLEKAIAFAAGSTGVAYLDRAGKLAIIGDARK